MILLRPATLADADLLRSWRNDETMRKNSFHSSVVRKREHMRWLRTSLKSKTRKVYIAYYTEDEQCPQLPLGEGRLDFDGGAIKFDIEVAPEHRGQGYGRQIFAALIVKAREWKPGAPLIAHVKASNTPSLRMFLGAGFEMKSNQCLELEMR